MKTILTILLLALALNCASQNIWHDEWLKQDKALHFGCSAVLTMVGTTLATDLKFKNPELVGVTFSLAVGLSKEFLYDTSPSAFDIGADIAGAIVGVYINRLVQKITPKWVKKEGFTVNIKWINTYGKRI